MILKLINPHLSGDLERGVVGNKRRKKHEHDIS